MRLVALYLVQHRLGLPLPAEVLRRWIALWRRRGRGHRLEEIAAGQTGLLALTAPWWLDAEFSSGCGGWEPAEPVASSLETLPGCLPAGGCDSGLGWRLVPLRLGCRPLRLLRSRWQQALLLYETACQLAQQAGVPRPWKAGQLAAVDQVLQAAWFRLREGKQRTSRWVPATEEQLRQAFPWLEALHRQLQAAQRHHAASTFPRPEPEDREHVAWAALARWAVQQQPTPPGPWHQVMQQARSRAVALAARLSLPGRSFQQLALDWDRTRRRGLRLQREYQHRLFRAKQHALAHWAAGAGHMLNNPLAVIAGRAQMALRDTKDPAVQKHLQVILGQAQRAHRMIAGLALYAHPPGLQREWALAEELLEELQRQFQPLAQIRKVQLRWRAAPGVAVRADRYQLAVAVQALVENALAAVEEGGGTVGVHACWVPAPPVPKIRPGQVIYGNGFKQQKDLPLAESAAPGMVSPWASALGEPRMETPTKAATGWLELSVEDSGPGVSPQEAPWLFDPFYSGMEAGRGMGMGLCFVWRIVQQHGGVIRVDRTPSRFTLWLPQAQVAAPLQQPRQHGAHGSPPPPHGKHPATSRSGASPS